MLKSTSLILLTISTFSLSAQQSRVLILGNINSEEKDLTSIHIINKTSNKGSISSKNGQFSIWVKNNDTIIFRGIQFESTEKIITKANIDNKSIQVELKTRTNILKEVIVKKPENMAMALNLPNAGKTPLKGVDLKLAYYSQKSTPMVILEMLVGKQGGIDDLYNIISGNRKKHRKLKKLIEDDKRLEHDKNVLLQIRKHYKDGFFTNTLKIKKEKIDDFIQYCKPKNIITYFDKESYLEVIDVFIKESRLFLKDLENEE